MKKFLLGGAALLFVCFQSNATIVDSITAGALEGSEVVVELSDGSSVDAVFGGADVSGEAVASGSDFSIAITGNTFAEAGEGIYSFSSSALEIVSIFINLVPAGLAFDPFEADVTGPGGAGLPFVATSDFSTIDTDIVADFGSALFGGGLFSTLLITSESGAFLPSSFGFAVDTDFVSAPAAISLFLLALGGIVLRRKQS